MNKADRALCTPSVGTVREVRGGSWNNNRNNVRCANRNRNTPDNRNNNVGFRCANTRRRSVKMPQRPATVAAAGAGALIRPAVLVCLSRGAITLCQKGVHALFPVDQTGNPITRVTVASGRRLSAKRRRSGQPEAGHSPLLAYHLR